MSDPTLLDLIGKPLLQVLGGLDPRGSAALLCTCRLLLDFQDKQAGDIWQAYVKQHLGPATAALHQLPVARGQLCEQGRYWRLVFSSSQQLRHAAWWRAGAKQLLRSCTGLPQTPAAGGSAHSAPLQCQQGPGTHGQDAFCSTAAATGSSTAAAEALLARAYHTATVAGHLLVLVGGRLRDRGSMDGAQDVCVIDMRSLRVWSPVIAGRPLGPRQQHSTLLIPWSQQGDAPAEPQGLLEYTVLQVLRQALPQGAAPAQDSSGPEVREAQDGASSSWQAPAAAQEGASTVPWPAAAAATAAAAAAAAAGTSSEAGLAHAIGAASSPDVLVAPVAAASEQQQQRLAPYKAWVHGAAAVAPGSEPAAGSSSGRGPAAPSGRGHLLVVLGGVDGSGAEVPWHTLDCLWLSEEGEDGVWFQVRVPPLSEDPDDPLPAPSPRAAAAVHLLPCGQQVLLYGGSGPEVAGDWSQSRGRLAVHILDLQTLQWRKQSTRAAGAGIWCVPGVRNSMVSTLLDRPQQARSSSSGAGGADGAVGVASCTGDKGALEGEVLVVLGGRDVSGHIHGTEPFVLDLNTWRWHMLLEPGASPPATWGAASYRIGDHWLLCYGGMGDHGQLLSRLDCFDLTALRWVGQPTVKGAPSSSLPRATTGATLTGGLLLGGLVQGMFGLSPAPRAAVLLLAGGQEDELGAGSGRLVQTAPHQAPGSYAPASNRLLQLLDESSSDEEVSDSSSKGALAQAQWQLQPWGGTGLAAPAATLHLQPQALPTRVSWSCMPPAAASDGYAGLAVAGPSSSSGIPPALGVMPSLPPMLSCLSEPDGAAGAAPAAATAAAVPMERSHGSSRLGGLGQGANGACRKASWPPVPVHVGHAGLAQASSAAHRKASWPPVPVDIGHAGYVQQQQARASSSAGCWPPGAAGSSLGYAPGPAGSSLGYGPGAAGSSLGYGPGAAGNSFLYDPRAAGSSLGHEPVAACGSAGVAAAGGAYGGAWASAHALPGSSSSVGMGTWQAGGSSGRVAYVDHLGSSGFRYSAQCGGLGGMLGGLPPLLQQHQHQPPHLGAISGAIWQQQQQQGAGSSLPPSLHAPAGGGSEWGAGSAHQHLPARHMSVPADMYTASTAQQPGYPAAQCLPAPAPAPLGVGTRAAHSYLPLYMQPHSNSSSMDHSGQRACNSMGALDRPAGRVGYGLGGAGSSRLGRFCGPDGASASADAAALLAVRALFGEWDGAAPTADQLPVEDQQQQKARRNSAPSPRGRTRGRQGGLGLLGTGDQPCSSGMASEAGSSLTVAGVYAAAAPLEWEEQDEDAEEHLLGGDVPNPGKSGSTSESLQEGSACSRSSSMCEESDPDSGDEEEVGGISLRHGIRGKLLIKRAQQKAAEAAAAAAAGSGGSNSGDGAATEDVWAHLVDLVGQLQQQDGSPARVRHVGSASSVAGPMSGAASAPLLASGEGSSSSGPSAMHPSRRATAAPVAAAAAGARAGAGAATLTRRVAVATSTAAAASKQGDAVGAPGTQATPLLTAPPATTAPHHVATAMQLHWRLLLVVQALLVGTMLLVLWQHWL